MRELLQIKAGQKKNIFKFFDLIKAIIIFVICSIAYTVIAIVSISVTLNYKNFMGKKIFLTLFRKEF